MTFVDLRMVLDLLILAFLIGTIIHATMLNRNLNRLRDGRAELDTLVQNLSSSVARAEAAIQGLKRSATDCGVDLQKQIDAARSLADELHIMNESGNNLAQRLEKSARVTRSSFAADDGEPPGTAPVLRAVRPETAVAAVPAKPRIEADSRATTDAARRPKMASHAERELMAAIETARKGIA